MLKQLLFASFLGAIASTSAGCATMMASKTVPYEVISSVPGAEVRVNGIPFGRTPTTVDLDRKRPQRVEVSMPGYLSQSCRPRTTVGVLYALGDVALCLGFMPLGCISFIDAGGAWNQLEDETCSVHLEPAVRPSWPQAAPAPPQPTSYQPQASAAGFPPPPPPPAIY